MATVTERREVDPRLWGVSVANWSAADQIKALSALATRLVGRGVNLEKWAWLMSRQATMNGAQLGPAGRAMFEAIARCANSPKWNDERWASGDECCLIDGQGDLP